MNKNLPALAVLAAAAALAPAAAQNVYRCGDSYSQQPCPGGTLVPTEDTRNASQRAQTSAAAQRDAKAANAMEKARLKEEAKPVPGYIPPPKAEAVAQENRPELVKPKKPQYFTAAAPRKPGEAGARKKKKKVKKTDL